MALVLARNADAAILNTDYNLVVFGVDVNNNIALWRVLYGVFYEV